jgi:hypothetical protein
VTPRATRERKRHTSGICQLLQRYRGRELQNRVLPFKCVAIRERRNVVCVPRRDRDHTFFTGSMSILPNASMAPGLPFTEAATAFGRSLQQDSLQNRNGRT